MKTLILTLAIVLAGCTTAPPAPLKPGATIEAPHGCKIGQVRGVEC